jgi:alkane 1-monooxygenase
MTASAISEVATPRPAWRDGKRYAWLLGVLVPAAVHRLRAGGADRPGVFWFFGPILIFGVFPPLDRLIGPDAENPPDGPAHELGHKRDELERWLSKIALAQSGYGHFFVEHNRGHHVRVATPEDPASARMGESFWAFLPRTVKGSLTSAWELEREWLGRHGRATWSIHNNVLNAWAMTVVVFGGLTVAFGPRVLPFLLIQMFVGFPLLEVVNYLEHYGLLRQKRPDGRYERTRPEHSWNSNNVASNVLLYHLQRHSDHHANPTRRFQALRHSDEAPQLPTGYAGMILLALIPPLWRRAMDGRLLAHYGGDVNRANIHPRARRRVLARYGPVG